MNKINDKAIIIAGLLVNIIFISYSIYKYYYYGYLPQPFSVDYKDSLMDFYNVNYHALTKNFYTGDFRSIYSPIFRAISEAITLKQCKNLDSSIELRECSIASYSFILINVALNLYLLIKILSKYKDKYILSLLMTLSFPMMYAIERGNYIVTTFTIICFMVLTKNRRIYNTLYYILPIFKYYFIAIFFLNARKSLLLIPIRFMVFIAINVILFSIFGDDINQLFKNLFLFTEQKNIHEILVATSISNASNNKFYYYICFLIKLFILFRLYLFINLNIAKNIAEENYMIMVITLSMLIIVSSIGFYLIILIFPMMCKLIENNNLTRFQRILFYLLLIPYPIDIYTMEFTTKEIYREIGYQIQGIFVPAVLIMLFITLTEKYLNIKNENKLQRILN